MGIVDFGLTVVMPALFGAGAGWVLLYFFGQRFVDHRLKKDLDRYQVELAEKTEALKTQLAIYAHEQNVAASRVDAQRSSSISNLYSCIRNVVNPTSSIVAGCPIQGGTTAHLADYYVRNAQEAHSAVGVLSNKLADLAIFFDNDTYLKIVAYAKVSMRATAEYLDTLLLLVANDRPEGEILAAAEAGRPTLKKLFEEEMKPKAMELAGIFRAQLGVERKDK
jgi:hypothetical protein